jgi:hypothetical protein
MMPMLTLAAGVLFMGASMVCLTVHFGKRMQDWADKKRVVVEKVQVQVATAQV